MVKITDTDVIRSGERELIDAITGDLDWSAIEALLREKHNLGLQDDVDFRNGDLVVHDNRVAYRLDFDVKITLSVVFDREGNCLKLTAAGETEENSSSMQEVPTEEAQEEAAGDEKGDRPSSREENVSQMASEIADMITDINTSPMDKEADHKALPDLPPIGDDFSGFDSDDAAGSETEQDRKAEVFSEEPGDSMQEEAVAAEDIDESQRDDDLSGIGEEALSEGLDLTAEVAEPISLDAIDSPSLSASDPEEDEGIRKGGAEKSSHESE